MTADTCLVLVIGGGGGRDDDKEIIDSKYIKYIDKYIWYLTSLPKTWV